MEVFMITLTVIIIIAVIILIVAVFLYNRLVKLRNLSEQAWSDIDVQLQRRYNLIPNLVETVKGYAIHERETFENVIKARQQAVNIKDSVPKKARAENFLTQALRQLFAVAEAYPELKANQNFLELQDQLEEVENHIQLARRYYNAVARDLNNAVQMFPSNIVANTFAFHIKDYFELEDVGARIAPEVRF